MTNKMYQDFNFFKTTMPSTRKADYYLGCLDGSVFIDFNRTPENLIALVRISFDGYGCCNLDHGSVTLNQVDSLDFMNEMEKEEMNQSKIFMLVKEIVYLNKDLVWMDALKEYGLIENKK